MVIKFFSFFYYELFVLLRIGYAEKELFPKLLEQRLKLIKFLIIIKIIKIIFRLTKTKTRKNQSVKQSNKIKFP